MQKPLIGIVSYEKVIESTGWHYDACYALNAIAIEKAGGLPILIPSHLEPDNLRAIYERVDAVMFPGGGDMNPEHYHADKHARTAQIDDNRDITEINLMRWAIEDDRPVLGICRGIQVMNVAQGGTLVQDIPSEIVTDLTHDIPSSMPRSSLLHEVEIDRESRLSNILGTEVVSVNSLHHQSIDQVAPNAQVIAKAPDGIIEAIEFPQQKFALGVQWHPEDMTDSEAMDSLFRAFVDAAREWMS